MTYIFTETTMVKQLTLKGTLVTVPRDHQPIKMIASGAVLPEGNPFRHSSRKKAKARSTELEFPCFPLTLSKFSAIRLVCVQKHVHSNPKKDYLYVPMTFLTCICFTYIYSALQRTIRKSQCSYSHIVLRFPQQEFISPRSPAVRFLTRWQNEQHMTVANIKFINGSFVQQERMEPKQLLTPTALLLMPGQEELLQMEASIKHQSAGV